MAPEHQFFENEERHDAEQHGCRRLMHFTVLKRVRQNLQKGSPKQGANGVGDQHADAMGAKGDAQHGCGADTQGAAGQRNGNDPGKSTQGN